MRKILLALSLALIGCAEKIHLYKAELVSTDINGSRKFGPAGVAEVSDIIENPPVILKTKVQNLGKITDEKNARSDVQLIDVIFENNDFGKLDEAYVNYLNTSVIPNKSFLDSTTWNEFLAEWNATNEYHVKKKILFQPKYQEIRKELEESVAIIHTYDFEQKHQIESTIKAGLEAKLKSVIEENNLEMSASLKAAIENFVNKTVNVEGKYLEVEFDKRFKGDVLYALETIGDKSAIDFGGKFLHNYNKYFIAEKGKIVTNYSLLELKIKYKTSEVTKSNLKGLLSASFDLPESKLEKISGNMYLSFSFNSTFNGEASSENIYLVKYGYDTYFEKLKN